MEPEQSGGRSGGLRLRRWIAVALGTAALLGLGLLWGKRQAEPGGELRAAVATPPPVARAALAPPGTPGSRPSQPRVAPAPDDLPEPIRRYLEATVYPPTSGRLTHAHTDLLHPNRRFERPRAIPETVGGNPSQVVSSLLTADHYHYTGDAVVHATLEAWRGGNALPVRVLDAWVVREGRDGPEGDPERLHFSAAAGRLEADLDLARFEDHHGPLLLGVRFEYAPGRTHEESIRFFYTPTAQVPGQLTGTLRDSVKDGSLLLEAGVQIERDGFYRFETNLYDAAGEPVAFAIFKGELAGGTDGVPLEVYGKVLRDAGVEGPYTVGELRGYRFLDGEYPDREHLPALAGEWTTEAYALDAFTEAPYTSDHKQRMVELMMEDLEAGIGLDVPGLPQPGESPAPRPPDDDAEVPVGPSPPEPVEP